MSSEPYENERQASAAARAVIPPEPDWSILSQSQHIEVLHLALADAGVETSDFEERTLAWLSGWEDYTVAIIARWIATAAEPAPGTEIEWAVRIARSNDVTSYDEGTARQLMGMLRENGTPAVLYRREVGPWTPAPGEGTSDA